MDLISRFAFGVSAAVLILLSLALSLYAAVQIVLAFSGPWDAVGSAVLEAAGYVVIAVAVFDVAKYLIEEEVVRGRQMRAASEARRSLTKFLSTILIAIFLEALVTVFTTAKQTVSDMLYPTLLLLAGSTLVVCLGVFQRLSASVERAVEPPSPVDGSGAPPPGG